MINSDNILLRQCAILTLSLSLLTLSACGDKGSVRNAEDTQEGLELVRDTPATPKSGNSGKADGDLTNAEQLIAEHNIHWSHPFFFSEEILEGKKGPEAALVAYPRLTKLAGSKYNERQIRECHQFTRGTTSTLDMTYQRENEVAMRLFNERKADVTKRQGQGLEHDLSLYYFELIPRYLKGVEGEDKTALKEAFWQWCIGLPNAHFEDYRNNPLSL